MRRPYLVLCGVTAGWGTIPVLAGWSRLPAPLIVAIRLWTAAACLGVDLVVDARRRRGRGEGGAAGSGPGRPGEAAGAAVAAPAAPVGGADAGATVTASANPAAPVGGADAGATASAGAPAEARAGRSGGAGPPRPFSARPVLSAVAAATLAVHWLALFAAYQRAPVGTVILIVYLAPLGVAALSPRLLGERLGRRTAAALAVATAGFCLVAAPSAQAAGSAGLALALVAAGLFVALILVSKPLASVYGGLRLAFMELGGAGLVLAPVALTSRWPPLSASWLWVVAIGVVHTALGITLYLNVLARVPATHVGVLSYLEPVAVVIAAWVWLGQRPGPATVMGGLLVVAAGAWLAAGPVRPERPERGRGASSVAASPAVPSAR